MKLVIFAGGLGTRLKEETEFRPKPMIEIGGKPILWHIMKIYSSFGVDEFIILAGYKSEMIRDYFANYWLNQTDVTYHLGNEKPPEIYGKFPESGWKVTVADTGPSTPTGERLLKVRKYLQGERFFCTYGDGVGNIDVASLLQRHVQSGKMATVSVTSPPGRFGVVEVSNDGTVSSFSEKPVSTELINAGFFVMEPEVFEFLEEGATLEESLLRTLAGLGRLGAYRHEGFWQPMDTYRESRQLNDLWDKSAAPWKVWND